jgi:hypothetical protein
VATCPTPEAPGPSEVGGIEAVPRAMATMFVHHVEAAVQRCTVTRPGARVDVAELAVGFLDLEGSTALVQELSAHPVELFGLERASGQGR